jgi:endoribonuclease Dicer
VEALIGAYLIDCGSRGALLFMAWLGIRVLPVMKVDVVEERIPGSTKPYKEDDKLVQTVYGHWRPPKSPLLHSVPKAEETLERLLDGFDQFEKDLDYKFNDRSYLLQAMTHASYSPNRLTDCYQRLEFLGDAVLDYLITRHLYEDRRLHSPGALTDLRSALVNNTIFASLAVRHGFHKYFRHLSPALNEVIDRFVRIQHENGHCISEEYYLLSEEECDEAEDVEVPKALGDVFESVAGAIFLDSNMSLDAVWRAYYKMMGPEIEQFSRSVPKSPIRELLELEPETAKFGKPEKLADGRRVRVTVEVFGKGIFRGIGRNYRIAKCTAAKCALRQLKKNNLINKKHS